MRCPFCATDDTKVVDSRLTADATKFVVDENAQSVKNVLQPLKVPNYSFRILLKIMVAENLLMNVN